MRGTYAQLQRRLGLLEDKVARVPRVGCPTCAGWPSHVVQYPTEPLFDPAPGAPRYCRPWALLHAEGCRCVRCDPRQGWPEGLRCPGCGRRPQSVVRVVYSTAGGWPGGRERPEGA